MLDALTPEQRDHMLQLISNGTAQTASPTEGASHHTRARLYDPVGTGRLEDGNVTGVHISSIDDDEMVIGGTTLTAVHVPAPMLTVEDGVNITCSMLGLPANCSQDDLLDAIDLKADDEGMALLLNSTAYAPGMQLGNESMLPEASMVPAPTTPEAMTPGAMSPEAMTPEAMAPVTMGAGVLAEATPAPPNATIIVVNSGGSNGTTIAVIVLVSVILAGIGAFVLHKHRKDRQARSLHQELESGGDWDWRDGEGSQTVELAKARALFDNVDEEFQSLNGRPPKSAPKVMRAAKLK